MLQKPIEIESWLNNLNWEILGIRIHVGDAIEAAIDWLLSPLNEVVSIVHNISSWLGDLVQEITDAIRALLSSINEIWEKIQTLGDIIVSTIAAWWDGVYSTITDWIQSAIDGVLDALNELWSSFNGLVAIVDDFFDSVLPELATYFDVGDMIQTALEPIIELFNIFGEFRDELIEFFNDPLEWIWQRFADWFLGPE